LYGHPVFSNEKDLQNNSLKDYKIFKSTSIDELVSRYNLNPTFIKIDVEGAEHNVIEGMIDILKTKKPIIMIEKHPTLVPKSSSITEIDKLLEDEGYKLEKQIFKDEIAITEIWNS